MGIQNCWSALLLLAALILLVPLTARVLSPLLILLVALLALILALLLLLRALLGLLLSLVLLILFRVVHGNSSCAMVSREMGCQGGGYGCVQIPVVGAE